MSQHLKHPCFSFADLDWKNIHSTFAVIFTVLLDIGSNK